MSRQDDRNGGSSLLRRLWGELGVSWGERILHHGARVLLVVVLAGLLTSFFLPAEGPVVQPYDSWSVAPEDVIARFSFDVPKTPAELEAEQNSVREGVPPTFDFVPEFADTMRAELERFFDTKVYLALHVKVRSDWRENDRLLNDFGMLGSGE